MIMNPIPSPPLSNDLNLHFTPTLFLSHPNSYPLPDLINIDFSSSPNSCLDLFSHPLSNSHLLPSSSSSSFPSLDPNPYFLPSLPLSFNDSLPCSSSSLPFPFSDSSIPPPILSQSSSPLNLPSPCPSPPHSLILSSDLISSSSSCTSPPLSSPLSSIHPHLSPPTITTSTSPTLPIVSNSNLEPIKSNYICSNCLTTDTPLWRRSPDKSSVLCNACSLYLRTNGLPRPLRLCSRKSRVSTFRHQSHSDQSINQPNPVPGNKKRSSIHIDPISNSSGDRDLNQSRFSPPIGVDTCHLSKRPRTLSPYQCHHCGTKSSTNWSLLSIPSSPTISQGSHSDLLISPPLTPNMKPIQLSSMLKSSGSWTHADQLMVCTTCALLFMPCTSQSANYGDDVTLFHHLSSLNPVEAKNWIDHWQLRLSNLRYFILSSSHSTPRGELDSLSQ